MLQRPDLTFAVLRHKNGDLMWHAIDVLNREIVVYNGTKQRLWSYYYSRDPVAFVRESRAVRIVFRDGKWVLE